VKYVDQVLGLDQNEFSPWTVGLRLDQNELSGD
jgi:hypothetical protein